MNAKEKSEVVADFASLLIRRIDQGVIESLDDLRIYLSGVQTCHPDVLEFFTKGKKNENRRN